MAWRPRVACYHICTALHGTFDGGREKAPAAICRKVVAAKLSGANEIEIWGDGRQTRSFMYIDDCIKGTQLIFHSGEIEAEPRQRSPRHDQ
jgi:nucleoside-diphosphate-sugar epimerase